MFSNYQYKLHYKVKRIHELIIKSYTLCPDVIIVYTNSIKKIFVMIVAKAAHFMLDMRRSVKLYDKYHIAGGVKSVY